MDLTTPEGLTVGIAGGGIVGGTLAALGRVPLTSSRVRLSSS